MSGIARFIRLNIRYYERLLTRDNMTYTPEVALKLLEDARARLPRAEADESLRRET
jgi:hypothetical protein